MAALNNERVVQIDFIFLPAFLLHKPSGFFWDPLQPYNSYMYSCILLYFG